MAADWEQLKTLFTQAVDLPVAERDAFVAELILRDADLGHELQDLLNHDEQSDAAISEAISSAITEIAELPFIGQSMGAYVIVDTIATGGMGTVYRGRRNDAAFDQDVAIKVMSQFVSSEENLARFRSERQILAQLSHPYIAEIFDGGTTGQGLPYLVMEHIEGHPIDEHCRLQELSDRQRIELFLKVCEAVSLSHQNLIVHRDIKPSNVLVTQSGTPKLLDFGIAKPIGPAQMQLTAPDLRAMTPEYASPEQVRGEAITTQTDIYALGLLLYRILSDKMPYATTGVSAGELEKSICETDPDPLTRTSNSNAPVRKRFRVTPDFPEDLNTIVMCALQKDPHRRYASVTSLVDDIKAYLTNEPIAARPDSTVYRAQLFCRRHRFGVGISVVAMILGVAFTIYTYQQAVKLEIEKTTAERSMEFLTGMFRATSPTVHNAEYGIMPEMKVSELLDLGVARVHSDLDDQPLVQARLLSELGNVYGDRGDTSKAIELLDQANTMLLELGEDPGFLAESRASAGWLLLQQTRYDAADAVMSSAYQLLVDAGLHNADPMIKVATDGAVVKAKLGEYERAHELYNQATKVYHDLSVGDPTRHAAILHNQSWTYWLQGHFEESEEAHLASLKIWEEHLPADHPTLAASYDSGAGLKIALYGDVVTAEELYQKAMAIDAKTLGEQHPEFVRDLLNYALLLEQTGRITQAKATNQQALATINSFAEADYEYRGTAHIQLAENTRLLGDFDRAREHLAEYEEILTKRESQDFTQHKVITAKLLADQGELEVALTLLHSNRPTHTTPSELELYLAMGSVAQEANNQTILNEVLEYLGNASGLEFFGTLAEATLSASVLFQQGERAQAITEQRQVLKSLQSQLPNIAPEVINAQLLLARWLQSSPSLESAAEARQLFESARQGLIASGRNDHPQVQQTLTAISKIQ